LYKCTDDMSICIFGMCCPFVLFGRTMEKSGAEASMFKPLTAYLVLYFIPQVASVVVRVKTQVRVLLLALLPAWCCS